MSGGEDLPFTSDREFKKMWEHSSSISMKDRSYHGPDFEPLHTSSSDHLTSICPDCAISLSSFVVKIFNF